MKVQILHAGFYIPKAASIFVSAALIVKYYQNHLSSSVPHSLKHQTRRPPSSWADRCRFLKLNLIILLPRFFPPSFLSTMFAGYCWETMGNNYFSQTPSCPVGSPADAYQQLHCWISCCNGFQESILHPEKKRREVLCSRTRFSWHCSARCVITQIPNTCGMTEKPKTLGIWGICTLFKTESLETELPCPPWAIKGHQKKKPKCSFLIPKEKSHTRVCTHRLGSVLSM